MSEDRKRILGMLAEGKITAEEAETLLDAVHSAAVSEPAPEPVSSDEWPEGPSATGATPRFLYVKVTGGADKVDVKIPLAVLRAGLKLTSLIPSQALDQINDSIGEHGMSIDLNNIKPEDIETLIESLREMEINVQSDSGEHVRVFCA